MHEIRVDIFWEKQKKIECVVLGDGLFNFFNKHVVCKLEQLFRQTCCLQTYFFINIAMGGGVTCVLRAFFKNIRDNGLDVMNELEGFV